MISDSSLIQFLRSRLAGWLFSLAGKLDAAYDVWLDDAPRRSDGPFCEVCGGDFAGVLARGFTDGEGLPMLTCASCGGPDDA